METNNIIALLLDLKKRLNNNQRSVIDRDLIKMHLLSCYELLLHDIKEERQNQKDEVTSSRAIEVQSTTATINTKEEINPFVAEIIEETTTESIHTPITQKNIAQKKEDSTISFVPKTEETESINDQFEHEGGSLNDRFQLSVNKGLNERTSQGDLKKLIDFNRQFVFIQELFNNDASAYLKTIEQLNNSSSLEEAFAYLNKEIIHFYKWRPELQSVKLFEKLVRQKFGV